MLEKAVFFKGEKSMALLPTLKAATLILLTFVAFKPLTVPGPFANQTSLDLRNHKGHLTELGQLESLLLL